MTSAERRIAREWTTIQTMIRLYCRDFHGGRRLLCAECDELLTYAEQRLAKCPFSEEKPTCVSCPVHCYEVEMRELVQVVMRYAGPRMLLRHPILALLHLRDAKLPMSEKARKVTERLRRQV